MKKTVGIFITGLGLALVSLLPTTAFASDSNITSVTIDSVSSRATGNEATYVISFPIAFGIFTGGGVNIKMYEVTDGIVGSSDDTTFDFSVATLSSDDVSATGDSVDNDNAYSLLLTDDLTSGSYTITLTGVTNTLTEGDYAIGMSSAFEATDDDYTMSDSFTIAEDPCAAIETAELNGVDATVFGTNVDMERGTYTDSAVGSYSLAYATSQTAIDNDTAETEDMTDDASSIVSGLSAKTEYFFQVRALSSDNCVLAQDTVTATTKRKLSNTRQAQPIVKKIKKRRALVKWTGNTYIDRYTLQLWKGNKKKHVFTGITVKKKQLKKKFLKSAKKYKVRVRAIYVTGEKSDWSKYRKLTTK